MRVIAFDLLSDCKDVIKKINKSMGLPSGDTLTWDDPRKILKGLFVILKPEEKHLKNIVYTDMTIKRSELIGELPNNLKVDESVLTLKTSNKYFLIKRIDDFKEMTIEIIFSINGEKQSFKTDASLLTPSKNGFSVNIDNLILDYIATI